MKIPVGPLLRRGFRHPNEVVLILRAGWRFRRRGWWRHAPFVPVPDPKYWAFRTQTALGDQRPLSVMEMVEAAKWSLRQPRAK